MKSSGISVVGIEGGATHTTVLWVDSDGAVLREFSLGPANALLLTDAELVELFREVKRGIGDQIPDAICVGLAGVRGDKEALRVRSALEQCWPSVQSKKDLPDRPAVFILPMPRKHRGSTSRFRAKHGKRVLPQPLLIPP